ncbi:MAG: anthranilate synthase component I [Phormidesmis sp.]
MSVSLQAGVGSAVRPCEKLFWQQLPLQNRTGSAIFGLLFQPQTQLGGQAGIATLLESPYPLPPDSLPEAATEMARFSICAGAPRVVEGGAQLWTPPIGDVLPLFQRMGQHITNNNAAAPADLPFSGGWLGWLGYDCAWEIERLPWLKDDQLPFPVAFWYEPAEFVVLDHYAQQLWLAADTLAGLARMEDCLRRGLSQPPPNDETLATDISRPHLSHSLSRSPSHFPSHSLTHSLRFETEQAEFEQAVMRAKAHIRAGDVFQVNHSLRFQAHTSLSSWAVYKALHSINPSPFASYWHTPWGAVVSCSPERLVHFAERRAQSRPIAGTSPRGGSAVADDAIACELRGDRKENAEHIMLVDLERNDLGRVCKWGSVEVAELMTIERYSHVMHLVSNVVGELDPKIADSEAAASLIAALFPGGTITGCPKVRCMEIIEDLEPVRRSLFYGSCGYFDRQGRLDLNILIRTLLMAPVKGTAESLVWGQVGAGIVADSQPEQEWYESLQKAKAQLMALGLSAQREPMGKG